MTAYQLRKDFMREALYHSVGGWVLFLTDRRAWYILARYQKNPTRQRAIACRRLVFRYGSLHIRHSKRLVVRLSMLHFDPWTFFSLGRLLFSEKRAYFWYEKALTVSF